MTAEDYGETAETIIEENSYLALATTNGENPWVATIEYIHADGRFYFFSTTDSRHARHIHENETVAVAIWGQEQPAYSPEASTTMNGVQIEAAARRLEPDDYPEAVEAAADALEPPMPPYAAYEIDPDRVYVPVIEDGVNERVAVEEG